MAEEWSKQTAMVDVPPKEVVMNESAERIVEYMREAAKGMGGVQKVKVMMVGCAGAGKTSLTRSLMNGSAQLVPPGDDRATVGVAITDDWEVGEASVSVWDFGGQEEYYMTHSFFLSSRSVVVLVVNLATFRDFESDVSYWMKLVQARSPGASIVLVGSHSDECRDWKAIAEEVMGKYAIASAKSAGEKGKEWPRIVGERMFMVSSKKYTGFLRLREVLEKEVRRVSLRLPRSYTDLGEELTRREGNVVRWREVSIPGVAKGMVESALRTLRDIGQILWFEEVEALREVVLVNPRWVVDVVKDVFRHDMFRTESGKDGRVRNVRPAGMTRGEVAVLVEEFETRGVLDERLLREFPMWKDKANFGFQIDLLKQFDLLCEIPPTTTSGGEKKYFLPLYAASAQTGKNEEEEQVELRWRYEFGEFLPDGIFNRLLVRCFGMGAVELCGPGAFSLDGVVVARQERKADGSGSISVASEDRLKSELESLLAQYPGVSVIRS